MRTSYTPRRKSRRIFKRSRVLTSECKIGALHADFRIVFGKVLRHPLGKSVNEYSFVPLGSQPNLAQQVINLSLDRAHLDLRIDQPGWTDHLFDDYTGRLR